MTEIVRLKAENHALRVQNWQLRVQRDVDALNAAGLAIEAECLADTPLGSTFDWQALAVVPPNADHTQPKES